MEYIARSASDKTDNWPFWYVARGSRTGNNVVNELSREQLKQKGIDPKLAGGSVLMFKFEAIELAEWANTNNIQV